MKTKKGFIFTLDLLLGMLIVFFVLATTLFFVNQGSQISLSDHQLTKAASTIVTTLIDDGTIESLDHENISVTLASLLTGNYDMLLRIQGNFTAGNGTIEAGNEIPEKSLIVAGRLANAYTENEENKLMKITYFVWRR